LSDDDRGGRAEVRDVDGARPLEGATRLERGASAETDAIAVRARPGREPRVELVGRLFGGHDGDVLRECRVESVRSTLERRAALDVKTHDLAGRMHTRVGAAGDRERVPAREYGVERLPHRSLDRAQPRLARPATELRPVVFESQLELHGSMARGRAEPRWQSSP